MGGIHSGIQGSKNPSLDAVQVLGFHATMTTGFPTGRKTKFKPKLPHGTFGGVD